MPQLWKALRNGREQLQQSMRRKIADLRTAGSQWAAVTGRIGRLRVSQRADCAPPSTKLQLDNLDDLGSNWAVSQDSSSPAQK